jgi:hypothetical protein
LGNTPPYPINRFPAGFAERFAADVAYLSATKPSMALEGNEWEQAFAHGIKAQWRPSNVGLDDVTLDNCCWSAKTVKSTSANIETQKTVRLISGRNSPTYSFGIDRIATIDPDEMGEMVLGIWNERVSGVRRYFKFARTVVLVKGPGYSDFLVFETDTVRYDVSQFDWGWNAHNNLEGYTEDGHAHRFTWQPHGSQFTIVEGIPGNRLHLRIKKPELLDRAAVLDAIGFDKSWVTRVGRGLAVPKETLGSCLALSVETL